MILTIGASGFVGSFLIKELSNYKVENIDKNPSPFYSKNTKKDLLHFYPEFSKKDIRVVYNGMSSDYSAIPNDKSDNQKKPFFLFV